MNAMQNKYVDGVKYRKYLREHKLNSQEVCQKAGIHHGYAGNVTAPCKSVDGDGFKCRANVIYWNLVCDALELPRDYFDYKEPIKEPERKIPTFSEIMGDKYKDILEEAERADNFTAIENYLDEYMPRVADIKELNSTMIELLARAKGIEALLVQQNELLEKKSAAIIKSQTFNSALRAWQRINGEK